MGINSMRDSDIRSFSSFTVKSVKRADFPQLTVFLGPIVHNENIPLHCLFCGKKFGAIRNSVLYIAYGDGYVNGKNSSQQSRCQNCKQDYHIVG